MEVVQITCRVWECPGNLTSASVGFWMASQGREQSLLLALDKRCLNEFDSEAEGGPFWHGRPQIVRFAVGMLQIIMLG